MKRQITIGEIAEINANSLTQKDMFQEIMYLDTGNITRNEIDNIQVLNVVMDKIPSRAKRKVKDKTIIYSTVRPNQEHYGFLENPSDNFIVSTGFSTIDVYDKDTDGKFIYYLLTQKHITDYLHAIGENSVSSYPSINPDDIANLKFAVPDFKTQQSIAAVLSALDKKIALNKLINARLEKMAKTLYDYWFVQFDFPNADGKPYKSSGGEMVFDETLKREIPKGWEVVTLKDFLTIKNGKDHKPLSDGKYTVYGSGGAIRCVDDYLFEGESVLIPRKGTLNNVMYVDEAFWTVDTMFYTEMKQDFFAKYVFYSIKDIDFTKFNLGTGVPSMTSSILYSLKIIKPSNCSLKHFEDVLKPIFLKIANNEKQNHQLIQLRDFLLPMLMNGQVSVTCRGARDG